MHEFGAFGAVDPALVGPPAPAQADPAPFVSPSGNIDCQIDAGGAVCDIRDDTYQPPPPPPCAEHFNWGSRFVLEAGKAATVVCHSDSLRVPGEPTLDYGQTRSAGSLTCASDLSGMKCTDSSTGHYFRVSHDSFDLG